MQIEQKIVSKRDKRKMHQEENGERNVISGMKKRSLGIIYEKKEESLDEHTKRIIQVRILMNKRDEARENNDFLTSDDLRTELAKLGVEVTDQKGGPSGWTFKDGSSKKIPNDVKLPEVCLKRRKNEAHVQLQDRPNNKKSKLKDGGGELERNKASLASVMAKTVNIQGVMVEDIIVGTGKLAENGKKVKVHYIGKLKSNGKVFDSCLQKPFAFRLGRAEVIRGWDIGVAGMRVGSKRILTIPPEKAYGKSGAPPTIPGNAALIFEVSLIDVL